MSYFQSNLKYLRKSKGLTQEQLANKVGVTRPIIGSYEEGRAEPKLSTLQNISHFFKLSIDNLLENNLSKKTKAETKQFENNDLRILPIVVDKDQNEKICLVPIKASAGYLNGYSDPEFMEELPLFNLPMVEFSQGTHRAFQIQGDSMNPIPSGSYIMGQFVEDWNWIKNGECYIIVSKNEGVVYKRLINNLNTNQSIELHSDNPEYEPYSIDGKEIVEVWEAKAYLSFDLSEKNHQSSTVEDLSKMMIELQKEVNQLKST
jgi:transcriptional regulator with XRE-family HTH domain